jgi:hypothetical protein
MSITPKTFIERSGRWESRIIKQCSREAVSDAAKLTKVRRHGDVEEQSRQNKACNKTDMSG